MLPDKVKRNLALKKLKRINIQALVEKSNYIQSFCINEQRMHEGLGTPVLWHSLPVKNKKEHPLKSQNWDLPESDIAVIKKFNKQLTDYAFILLDVVDAQKGYPAKAALSNITDFLPPWLVFPLYDPLSMGWRMGIGEDYMGEYRDFLKSLSEDEYEAYSKVYPCPDYMSDRPFR